MRLAFGTFLGLPDPMAFGGDKNFIENRWRASNCKALAARLDGRLIGSNFATRWGSFGILGPLTVLPEFWNKGVAQRLMAGAVKIFDRWGVRHSGLFTFPHSAKHIGLYQKFGYWPGYLTALVSRTPAGDHTEQPLLLSSLSRGQRPDTMAECARLTNRISKGLDLTAEIRSTLDQQAGDVVLTRGRGALDGFAICLHGAGTEGGSKSCYIKFGAARSGTGAGERFDRLLSACDAYAASRGLDIEAGINLARQDAFQRLRARGYRVMTQGVSMQRPHDAGFNRPDVYALDDWR